MPRTLPSTLLVACLVGCAAAPPALAPTAMPRDAVQRRESLNQLGLHLFEALRSGSVQHCVATPGELDHLVGPGVRPQIERERHAHESLTTGVFPRDWAAARYLGFCAQGAREEPAHGALGLSQPGWVLDRILVAVSLGNTRSAAWLDGRFVFTADGWKSLSVSQIEQPRRQHSDLDLAPCDVEAGLR